MSLIVGEGISKSWSERDVLRNVSFTLAPAQRAAMVGPNGHGKSTLLKIIAELDTPTSGKLSRKVGLAMGYLAQDPPDLGDITLKQAMHDVFAPLRRMELEMHELAAQLERPQGADAPAAHEKLLARYGRLQHEFEQAGGYTCARRIDRVLEGLDLPKSLWDVPLSHLSGGQRSRAHLGRLLLEQPEVLLLDEPTNHLDMASVEWLENYLADFRGALIVVSHDRYFLDHVTDSTWEVAFTAVESYKGSYSRYLPQRVQRYNERLKQWDAQQLHIEQTQEFIRRFIAGQRSKEAQGRRTRLERFMRDEAIEKPRQNHAIAVRFRAPQRAGDFAMHVSDLAAGYRLAGGGEKRLVQIEKLDIRRGQRVAIVGPNGCGKTTLLRTMLGQLEPLAGSVRLGANVQVGYLSQTHAELDETMTAFECVKCLDSSVSAERARGLLGQVGISGDESLKKVSELSGGQRSRILLARLMLAQPNLLILDEPTNHLDIPSQEVLQNVLADFGGTIVFVSHDRYLIQAMATTIWAVEGGVVKVLDGNWDACLAWRQATQQAAPQEDEAKQRQKQARIEQYKANREQTNKVKRVQKRLARVEQEIHAAEQTVKDIDARLAAASDAGNVPLITKLGLQHTETQQRIAKLMREWEELSLTLDGQD